MSKLLELAERVERAEGPDRELDGEIAITAGLYVLEKRGRDRNAWYYPVDGGWSRAIYGTGGARLPDFTRSIDAAMTLVPEGRQTLGVEQSHDGAEWIWRLYPAYLANKAVFGQAATPALALTAAALKARAAQEAQS